MAMTLDRTTILRDPARLSYNSGLFWSKGDIVITPVFTRSSISTAMHGVLDATRATDRMFRVTLTPSGTFDNLSVLFGGLSTAFGASLIGSSDKPLVIHTKGGTKYTFTNAALTKPPTIILSTKETIFGECEFMCILAKNSSPALTASYYAVASESYPGDTGFDPDTILTQAYEAKWAASGVWSSFFTNNGWRIEPTITVEPEVVDGLGTIDFKVINAEVMATAAPVGPSPADALTAMGMSGHLGGSRLASGYDLSMTAADAYVRLNNALLESGPLNFGTSRVLGDMTWKATRTFTDGAPNPLLIIADEDPDAE